jgi:hypothetical protein
MNSILNKTKWPSAHKSYCHAASAAFVEKLEADKLFNPNKSVPFDSANLSPRRKSQCATLKICGTSRGRQTKKRLTERLSTILSQPQSDGRQFQSTSSEAFPL